MSESSPSKANTRKGLAASAAFLVGAAALLSACNNEKPLECNKVAVLRPGDGTQNALAKSMVMNGIVGKGQADETTLNTLWKLDSSYYHGLLDDARQTDGFLTVSTAAQKELKKLNAEDHGDSELQPDNAFMYCWNGETVSMQVGSATLDGAELTK